MTTSDPAPQPLALVAIAAFIIVLGALIGATTNAVNGAVSPVFFVNIMDWHDVENVWRACIAQGVFQGLLFGLLFSAVFTLVIGLVSKATCSFSFALQYLLMIVAAIYACWILAGLLAIGLAMLSPEFYRRTFIAVPDEFGAMLRYAWVGGSYWGAVCGAVLSAVIGSVTFAARWRRHHPPVGP